MEVSPTPGPSPFASAGGRNAAQRPADSMPNGATRPERRPPAIGRRFAAGISSALNPEKLSALTRPTATSSPRAASTLVIKRPDSRTNSEKNSAPRFRSVSYVSRASVVSSTCSADGANASHAAVCSRKNKATGLERIGPLLNVRPRGPTGGESRAHETLPERHSPSSQSGS